MINKLLELVDKYTDDLFLIDRVIPRLYVFMLALAGIFVFSSLLKDLIK